MPLMTNAEAFLYDFGIYATELWSMTEAQFLEWLNAECDRERPADMVVRCKYCKHRERDEIFNQSWCKGRRVREDFFCADGERKPYTFGDAWQNLKNESEESREFFEEAERIAEELRGERKDDDSNL